MKVTCIAIALGVLCESAVAATAGVYLYDPRSPPRPQTTLDPVSARLVLAQRAGVEDFHGSDLNKREVIDAINEYGVRTSLFAAEQSRVKRAFILVEEEVDSTDAEVLRAHLNFHISPMPASVDSKSLFVDLAKQSDPRGLRTLSDESAFTSMKDSQNLARDEDVFYVAQSMQDFEAVFSRLMEQNSWSITALVISSTPSSANSKLASGEWGTYEMPGKQSPLKKRQTVQEKPLSETTPHRPTSTLSAPFEALANSSRPLKGILPACFHSQQQCNERTNGCTGHGQCKLKYHDKTASVNQDCYACMCTKSKSSNGKVTTYWGGPACQKKDVSVQFWLIVLFTVGMVFLIGFAIGQVWEMGDQELPSVIGAGVSGPTARK